MATLIHIDRSSIRPNPDAGKTEWPLPTVKHVNRFTREVRNGVTIEREYTSSGDPDAGGEWILRSEQRSAITLGPRPEDQPEKEVDRQVHQDYETFHTVMPAPDWFFKYAPTRVTCTNCAATFLHTEMQEDDYDVCPRCGEPECCDVEYEKIDDVIGTTSA